MSGTENGADESAEGVCQLCNGDGEVFVCPPRDNSSHVFGLMGCPGCTDEEVPEDCRFIQTWVQHSGNEELLARDQPMFTADEARELIA